MAGLGCCGVCVKVILIIMNVFYFFHGLILTCVGIAFIVLDSYVDKITGGSYVVIAIGLTVFGISIMVMAIVGIVGAASDKWCLLTCYLLFIFVAIGLQLAAGIWIVTHKNYITDQMNANFKKFIRSYNATYYTVENGIVDFVQNQFDCCGINGPKDWIKYNLRYVVANLGLPSSCDCYGDVFADDDNCISIHLPNLPNSDFSAWKKGCNETIFNTFGGILHGVGVAVSVLSGFYWIHLSLSLGLCCCVIKYKRNQKHQYVQLQYPNDSNVNYGTVTGEEPAPPAYSQTGHIQEPQYQTGHIQQSQYQTGHIQQSQYQTGHIQQPQYQTGYYYSS